MIRFSNFEFKDKHWSPLSEVPFKMPLLQAHRGYWVEGERQNSLLAFTAAYNVGFRMAEMDLRLTKDGQIVLFHDPGVYEVDHVTRVRNLTYEQLNSLVPVDTLDEVLKTLPKDMVLNLELKNESRVDFSLEEKLVAYLKKTKQTERMIFSSFNPMSLMWMRKLVPEIPRALLVTQEHEPWNSILLRELSLINLVKPHYLNLRWEDMDHYRDIPAERKVIWTLNDKNVAKTLLSRQKVFGIISDSIKPNEL